MATPARDNFPSNARLHKVDRNGDQRHTRLGNRRASVTLRYQQGLVLIEKDNQILRLPDYTPWRHDSARPIPFDSSGDSANSGSEVDCNSDSDSQTSGQLSPITKPSMILKVWDEEEQRHVEVDHVVVQTFAKVDSDSEEWEPGMESETEVSSVETEAASPEQYYTPAISSRHKKSKAVSPHTSSQPIGDSQGQSTSQPAGVQPAIQQATAPPAPASYALAMGKMDSKLGQPPKFSNDGQLSLDQWRLMAEKYCRMQQIHPSRQADVISSFLSTELSLTWENHCQQHPAASSSSDSSGYSAEDLIKWLESCTVKVDRKEDILEELQRMRFKLQDIPRQVTKVQAILARGVGDPEYTYPCSLVVKYVTEGLVSSGLDKLAADVSFVPGTTPNTKWLDVDKFLQHVSEQSRQMKAIQQGQQRGQPRQQQGDRPQGQSGKPNPKPPRTKWTDQPGNKRKGDWNDQSLLPGGKRPAYGFCDVADQKWVDEYSRAVGAPVCLYCKYPGHLVKACRVKQQHIKDEGRPRGSRQPPSTR